MLAVLPRFVVNLPAQISQIKQLVGIVAGLPLTSTSPISIKARQYARVPKPCCCRILSMGKGLAFLVLLMVCVCCGAMIYADNSLANSSARALQAATPA